MMNSLFAKSEMDTIILSFDPTRKLVYDNQNSRFIVLDIEESDVVYNTKIEDIAAKVNSILRYAILTPSLRPAIRNLLVKLEEASKSSQLFQCCFKECSNVVEKETNNFLTRLQDQLRRRANPDLTVLNRPATLNDCQNVPVISTLEDEIVLSYNCKGSLIQERFSLNDYLSKDHLQKLNLILHYLKVYNKDLDHLIPIEVCLENDKLEDLIANDSDRIYLQIIDGFHVRMAYKDYPNPRKIQVEIVPPEGVCEKINSLGNKKLFELESTLCQKLNKSHPGFLFLTWIERLSAKSSDLLDVGIQIIWDNDLRRLVSYLWIGNSVNESTKMKILEESIKPFEEQFLEAIETRNRNFEEYLKKQISEGHLTISTEKQNYTHDLLKEKKYVVNYIPSNLGGKLCINYIDLAGDVVCREVKFWELSSLNELMRQLSLIPILKQLHALSVEQNPSHHIILLTENENLPKVFPPDTIFLRLRGYEIQMDYAEHCSRSVPVEESPFFYNIGRAIDFHKMIRVCSELKALDNSLAYHPAKHPGSSDSPGEGNFYSIMVWENQKIINKASPINLIFIYRQPSNEFKKARLSGSTLNEILAEFKSIRKKEYDSFIENLQLIYGIEKVIALTPEHLQVTLQDLQKCKEVDPIIISCDQLYNLKLYLSFEENYSTDVKFLSKDIEWFRKVIKAEKHVSSFKKENTEISCMFSTGKYTPITLDMFKVVFWQFLVQTSEKMEGLEICYIDPRNKKIITCPVSFENFKNSLLEKNEELKQYLEESFENTNYTLTPDILKKNSSKGDSKVPEPVPDVEIEELLRLFEQINFSFPEESDYCDPAKLRDDGRLTTLQYYVKSLLNYVKSIQTNGAFFGVPANKERYYSNLKAYLTHIIAKIRSEEGLKARNDTALQLAEGGKHCGGRWLADAIRLYNLLILGTIEYDNVEELILSLFDRLKLGIVEEMVMRSKNPHEYLTLLRVLRHFGISIPASAGAEFDDPWANAGFNGDYANADAMLTEFMSRFTPWSLINLVNSEINRKIVLTKGKLIGELLEFFGDNILTKVNDCEQLSFDKAKKAIATIDDNYEIKKREILQTLKQSELAFWSNSKVDDWAELIETAKRGLLKRSEIVGSEIEKVISNKLFDLIQLLASVTYSEDQEDEKVADIEVAIKDYHQFLSMLQEDLLENEKKLQLGQKNLLFREIAIKLKYFTVDKEGFPKELTRLGTGVLLEYFKLFIPNKTTV